MAAKQILQVISVVCTLGRHPKMPALISQQLAGNSRTNILVWLSIQWVTPESGRAFLAKSILLMVKDWIEFVGIIWVNEYVCTWNQLLQLSSLEATLTHR